jgi:tetratricopeptide (TPR) repeat protein
MVSPNRRRFRQFRDLLVAGMQHYYQGYTKRARGRISNSRTTSFPTKRGLLFTEHDRDDRKDLVCFTQAIERNPNNADFYPARGQLHFRLGQCAPAVADFNAVLRRRPEQVSSRFFRAHCLRQLNAGDASGHDVRDSQALLSPEQETFSPVRRHW